MSTGWFSTNSINLAELIHLNEIQGTTVRVIYRHAHAGLIRNPFCGCLALIGIGIAALDPDQLAAIAVTFETRLAGIASQTRDINSGRDTAIIYR